MLLQCYQTSLCTDLLLCERLSGLFMQAQSVLRHRLPKWTESCAKPEKLAEECEDTLNAVSMPFMLLNNLTQRSHFSVSQADHVDTCIHIFKEEWGIVKTVLI